MAALAPPTAPARPKSDDDLYMCIDCGSVIHERGGNYLYKTKRSEGSVYCPVFKCNVPLYPDNRVYTQCLSCEVAEDAQPVQRPQTGRFPNRVYRSIVRRVPLAPASASEVMSDPTIMREQMPCQFAACASHGRAAPNLVAVDGTANHQSLARRFTCHTCHGQWTNETAVLLPFRDSDDSSKTPPPPAKCPFAGCPTHPTFVDGVRVKDERTERAGLHVVADRRMPDDDKPRYTCSECGYQWGDEQWVLKRAPAPAPEPAPEPEPEPDIDVGEHELFPDDSDDAESMDTGAGVGL